MKGSHAVLDQKVKGMIQTYGCCKICLNGPWLERLEGEGEGEGGRGGERGRGRGGERGRGRGEREHVASSHA